MDIAYQIPGKNQTPLFGVSLLQCSRTALESSVDKNFTFRFYDIANVDRRAPAIEGVLNHIASIASRDAREKLLAQDYTVRLENLERDGPNAIVGELTRCQNTNLPSEIDKADRRSLAVDRLGHSVVFRINHANNTMGMQYDPRIVSPGKFLTYLSAFNAAALYRFDPRINAAAWAKFNNGQTRKLRIRINNPEDMGDLDGAGRAASTAFRSMSEAFDAPSVYIEISMGHRRGFLSNAVGGLAAQLSRMNFPGVNLEKLSAVTVVNDETETIDLIEDRLVSKETLAVDDRDPDANWVIKRDYLNRLMQGLLG